MLLFLLIGVTAAVTALASAGWLVRGVTRPVDEALHVAERIARGRLDAVVPHRYSDEFGRLFTAIAQMQQRLRETVADLRVTATAIDNAAGGVNSGSQDLSARAEQAAAGLQQSVASLRALSGSASSWADRGPARWACSAAC